MPPEPESEIFSSMYKDLNPVMETETVNTSIVRHPIQDFEVSFSDDFHRQEPIEGEGAISWDMDDSREYFDEDNEPQLLETIPEESDLDLSDAEIDELDQECVKVAHKPSGTQIIVKKSFKGAYIVDSAGEIIDAEPIGDHYHLESVDPNDVRYGTLRRSNSETLLRAKRNFKGA